MARSAWVRWLTPLAAAVLLLLGPALARPGVSDPAQAAPPDDRAGVVLPLSPAWGIVGSRVDPRLLGASDPGSRLLLGTDPAAAAPTPRPAAAARPARPAAGPRPVPATRLGGRSPPA